LGHISDGDDRLEIDRWVRLKHPMARKVKRGSYFYLIEFSSRELKSARLEMLSIWPLGEAATEWN